MSWTSWLVGKRDARNQAREAIVGLQQQLLVLAKKEEHLNKKIAEEQKKAAANASTNKRVAMAALRQKKVFEQQLEQLAKTRLTLETQSNAIENANLNLETMKAMRSGADALRGIHGSLNIDKVDATMDSIKEQMDLTNEISEAISNPVGMGQDLDEEELRNELEELEQEELNARLIGADAVPVHSPSPVVNSAERARNLPQQQEVEDDDDAELRKLQAELAM